MTRTPLPLPEAAFSSWQSLADQFGRALRVKRQYEDDTLSHWAPYQETLIHTRRISQPVRIDQRRLAEDKARQTHLDATRNPASLSDELAKEYALLGFAEAAEVACQKAELLRQVDWTTIPAVGDLENPFNTPAEMQDQFDALYETEREIARAENLEHIRAQFASRTDDYTIMPNEAFNMSMVDMITASPAYAERIESCAMGDTSMDGFITRSPTLRKDFATAIVAAGVHLQQEIWEYLPRDTSDLRRRVLWIGKDGPLLVVETPHSTDDDPAPYLVQVVVTTWPDGTTHANFTYESTTRASREAQRVIDNAHIEEFMDAAQQLTDITNQGRFAGLHKLPLIGSLMQIITMALRPRMTFRFFRGMGQQGVRSGMILRHTGRAVFWTVLLWAFSATGVIGIMFQTAMAGLASWIDVAFLVGIAMGAAVLGQSIPTALGLIVGSFDRRGDRKWSANLPQTGHENFITRGHQNKES